jgi:ABC-type glutathione transport system ATPase component
MSPPPLLEVRDLCVELAGRSVLTGIGFAIGEGEITGLCGDSGSGKTTLALALMKLAASPPYLVRGEVLLHGRNLLALPERELQRVRGAEIACIFQDSLLALNPVLKIRTQIGEILRAHDKHDKRANPRELLELAGVPDAPRILDAYPHQLSGGERQRVSIAQALACGPSLVIADEPFTALDGPRVVELATLFMKLRDRLRTSFLLISHTPGVLAMTAGQVLRMSEGRIVERGPAREVLGQTRNHGR